MGKSGNAAYWALGEERCGHCLQPYAFVSVRHCHVCDEPACPHCVTVVAETVGDVVCVRCAAAPEEEL